MSDEQRTFDTGAKRDSSAGKGRMDLLPLNAILELAKHCQRGAEHYGANNVREGLPFSSLFDSGTRHAFKWGAGIKDEPTHLVAACWNLMWLLEESIVHPELNDMYWSKMNSPKPVSSIDLEFVCSKAMDDKGKKERSESEKEWEEAIMKFIENHKDIFKDE